MLHRERSPENRIQIRHIPDIGKRIRTPILSLAVIDNNEKEVQCRISSGDTLNGKNFILETALHHAAYYGRLKALKMLLLAGGAVDVMDKDGSTPLMHAVENGNLEIIKILLLYKANVNIKNVDGYSAIHLSCVHNRILVLKLFIQSLNLSATNLNNDNSDYKGNIVHIASIYGHVEIIKYLIDLGMNINKCENESGGWTPLQYACLEGNVKSVELLLQAGADPSIYNDEEEKPIELARGENHLEVLSLLA